MAGPSSWGTSPAPRPNGAETTSRLQRDMAGNDPLLSCVSCQTKDTPVDIALMRLLGLEQLHHLKPAIRLPRTSSVSHLSLSIAASFSPYLNIPPCGGGSAAPTRMRTQSMFRICQKVPIRHRRTPPSPPMSHFAIPRPLRPPPSVATSQESCT